MTTSADIRAWAARRLRGASFYRGLFGLVAMAIALGAWALASPVGASPDEDYHLASIWCAQGTREGSCESATKPDQREVLESLLTSQCYAFRPDIGATCQGDSLDANRNLIVSERGNFDGTYPPLFYYFMGLFVGPDIVRSVVVMRVANVLLSLALVTAVWLASRPGLRRGLVAGTTVTLVPLGAFVLASINPSSWALVSAMTLFVSVLGYISTEERPRRLVLGALAAVALAMGSGARADASMYALVAVGAAVIVAWRRPTWRHLRRLAYPAFLAVCAVVAFLRAGQSEALSNTEPMESSFNFLVRTLVDVPSLWTGALGGWGLGWLDTYLPALVWVGSWSVLVGVVFAALVGISRPHSLAVLATGAAVWVVSGYMQYISGYPVGGAIQPRYLLPLIVMVAVTACVRVDRPPLRWATSQWLLVVLTLSVANSLSLHFNIRRYVTGTDVLSANLDAGAEWWWGIPLRPMEFWAIGSVAFGLAVALLTYELRRPEMEPTGRDASTSAVPKDKAVLVKDLRTEDEVAAEGSGTEVDGAENEKKCQASGTGVA